MGNKDRIFRTGKTVLSRILIVKEIISGIYTRYIKLRSFYTPKKKICQSEEPAG